MSDTTHPEGVPLDVWLCNQDPPTTGSALRRRLADRLIDVYSPPGGIVVDLAPDGGEAVPAASGSGRSAVLHPPTWPCPGRRPPRPLAAIAGTADLLLSLPPASHLAPLRPHAPSRPEAEVLARQGAPLLRPGGFLVIGILGGGPGTDPVGATVAATTKAGLAYFQHVVALTADGLHFDADDGGADVARRLAHVDLLVFSRRAA